PIRTDSIRTVPIQTEDAAFYQENGFLIVRDALSGQEVQELRDEATRVCRGELGEIRGWVPSEPGDSDDDILRRYLCIHFPHKISATMSNYLGHPAIVDVLTKVIGPNVKCMQSMLF